MTDIKPGDMQTYADLIKSADVTPENIEQAVKAWLDNPPDADFDTILEAELVKDE